jgi:HEAT repeat protein
MTPQIEAKVKSNSASKDKMLATVSLWALAHVHPEDRRLLAQAVEQLIERLKDDDPYVRLAAARGLAALPSVPEITAPIFERALKDADETTLNHALDALARLGAPAVPKLVTGLSNEKFRPHALQVLRQIGPPAAPATKALAQLIDHADEDTARSALLALAAIGPGAKDAVPALVKALKQKDRPDGHAVIYALGRIGPAASDAKATLTDLLAGSDEDLALMSAWAIVKIDPSPATAAKAVPVLVSGLTARRVVMRRGAAEALGEMGRAARTSVEALQRATKDDDKSVRDAAAAALAAIQR